MRIISIVGTRPQLIKEAALHRALRARHDEVLIDTGQHYDATLAGNFFAELALPKPDHSLGIGGGSPSEQVGRMLIALEPILRKERADAVLVYGDTNSTLAGGLAAAHADLPLAHVEAGLRSFDRHMPEEINRVVVDHLAQWCFAPTAEAVENLAAEGIVRGVLRVGDLMHDLVASTIDSVRDPVVLASLDAQLFRSAGDPVLRQGSFLFATAHRAQNRDPKSLVALAQLLDGVSTAERPVIIALHPGTAVSLRQQGVSFGVNTRVIPPVGYRTSLALQLHAAAVLTDSGGIQRESAWLGTPCLVLRERTEWVEMANVTDSHQFLVGLDLQRAVDVLERAAPIGETAAAAADRSALVAVESSGAAEVIAATLAGEQAS